jgi:hypothetical protein
MSALALHSDWLRRLAVAYPSTVPQRLLKWVGAAPVATTTSNYETPARGPAAWLGWDAWVSPIDRDRSRSTSANANSTPKRRNR